MHFAPVTAASLKIIWQKLIKILKGEKMLQKKTCIMVFIALTGVIFVSGCGGGLVRKPFNGKDLTGWAFCGPAEKSKWVTGTAVVSSADEKQLTVGPGTGAMINVTPEHGASIDIYSKEEFGDSRIEIEVMVPKGSNSGIYVMGEYEIQVLDSYGREKMGSGDMGAIYGASPPPVNASKAPGQWQKYVIEFKASEFNQAGEKIANARFIKVELNGKLLHKDLEMPGPTPGGVTGKEAPTGPIMFQGNHGPVAYRNIRITPLNVLK